VVLVPGFEVVVVLTAPVAGPAGGVAPGGVVAGAVVVDGTAAALEAAAQLEPNPTDEASRAKATNAPPIRRATSPARG
jgi:hypothetical protein